MNKTITCGILGIIAISLCLSQNAHAVELTQPECNSLGKNMVDMSLGKYAFICGYPFNATIPYGTTIVWLDTDIHNHYHHTITSDIGLFNSDPTFFWQKTLSSDFGFVANTTYAYHDQLSSGHGYIYVASADTQPNAVWISTPQLVIDDGNHSTPLQLPPDQVGIVPKNDTIVQSNSTIPTINDTSSNQTQTVTVTANVTALEHKIDLLNEKIDNLSSKLDAMSTIQTAIFGMLTKLIQNFNLG